MGSLPGAIIAALLGTGIAALNYRLTKKAAASGSNGPAGLFGALPVIRMALSVGLLAAAYFLGPYTPWDRVWILAGAVVGLTVPLFFFTFLLVKQVNDSGGQQEQVTAAGSPGTEPERPNQPGQPNQPEQPGNPESSGQKGRERDG